MTLSRTVQISFPSMRRKLLRRAEAVYGSDQTHHSPYRPNYSPTYLSTYLPTYPHTSDVRITLFRLGTASEWDEQTETMRRGTVYLQRNQCILDVADMFPPRQRD